MHKSWIDKSEREIRDHIVEIAKEETGLTNFKSTGVLRGFIETIARIVIFIYQSSINQIYANATLKGASGIFLSFWGLLLGVARKQESRTTGFFTGTAYGSGSIPKGAWVSIPGTGIRFKIVENGTFEEGTFLFPVIAERPGYSYNIGSGTTLRINRVVAGLESVSAGDDWIVTPGEDEETDASYRSRIESRWKSQKLGDIKEVYKFRAESVAGVRAAHIIRAPRGPGSTDVVIAAANGLPGTELIAAVSEALYKHSLMAFDVQVKAPLVMAVTVLIEYTGEASEGEVALVAERYVHNLGIGGRFAKRELYELYRPLNLRTVEMVSPLRDVQPDERTIIVASINAVRIS
jgi:hypothetical protein